MPKVILINPSNCTTGYSFITPRWLFVLAQGTPSDLVGDPIIVDEAIERFRPELVGPGDIVGIGISSGNCLPGYRVLREAKQRGATVIVGGIHASIFPNEPLEMGADAVVTGNGDLIWERVVRDALDRNLQRIYTGGRVPGDLLLKARWDLLDPRKYMMASVQTTAGCPENCSFCSVWVTEGRRVRQRLSAKIIEEANELYRLGFRYIVFADDNFNPATLGRIARETSSRTRWELERIREERLRFFAEYDALVPSNLYAFTQMTSEVVSDDEYLRAMHDQMRIRTALVGVESFSQEGLRAANKQWNPAGQEMVRVIQTIQNHGILVLSSIICGLESDTIQTLRTMREFAKQSGTILAQFTIYNPYPGTKDFYEMLDDRKHRNQPGYIPKHGTRIEDEKFWLDPGRRVFAVKYANIRNEDLLAENQACWEDFYSLREVLRRLRSPVAASWPVAGKLAYILICFTFKRVYAAHGVAADSVQPNKAGVITRTLIQAGVTLYSRFFREKRIRIRVSLTSLAEALTGSVRKRYTGT